MSKHTPGPWEARGPFVTDAAGRLVVATNGKDLIPEAEANARLIAAAPELLDALVGLREVVAAAIAAGDWKIDGACDPDRAIIAARAAIAKAAP